MSESFASEFWASLISYETGNRFSLSDFFTNSYNRTYDFCDSLPYLLSRCDVSVTSPFSYESENLNAFCLIYTKAGEGRLFRSSHPQEASGFGLVPGTLAFIDCQKKHKLTCLHNIWEYTICFVSTPVSSYYYQKSETLGGCIFPLDSDPDALAAWKRFLRIQEDTEIHGLMRSRELTALYTQLCLSRAVKLQGSYHIPSYIRDIKKDFDTAYHLQYSLEALSAKYRVNKFRLCRDFSKYYNDTPLQYLNKLRIEKAKDLLLHSDETVGTIGQMVGIENTNHFIRLFKEKTGVTPLTYRRETPVL